MSIIKVLKQLEKLAIDNSPAILTAIGVTGTITTAYLAARASFRVGLDMNAGHYEAGEDLTTKEAIRVYWKEYIPAIMTGSFTVSAIVAANRVSTRRATAMAAAYSISERAFSEYKEKVVERLGDKKEQALRDEVAQDRVNKNPVNDGAVIITDNGDVLCYDHFTGRYFKSSMESLRQAENEINHTIIHQGYASLSDLYDIIGLPPTSFSDEVGWNTDYMLKMIFSTVMSQDNRPCISIDFDLKPNRKFSHFAGD